MDLKEQLEEFFLHYRKQISIEKLKRKFHIDASDIDNLLSCLYELEREGKIIFDNNLTYMHVPCDFYYCFGKLKLSNSNQYYINLKDGSRVLIRDRARANEGDFVFVSKKSTSHPKQFVGDIKRVVKKERVYGEANYYVSGVLQKEGSHFYVSHQDSKIYIAKEALNTAFVGDMVHVLVRNRMGSVISVEKRNRDHHIFHCILFDGKLKWVPNGISYGLYELDDSGFSVGDVILASFEGKKLKLVKRIDNDHTIHSEINHLLLDFGFYNEFSIPVLNEASNFSKNISDEDVRERVDLRDLETFTIDPVDAKDLDDAVSLVYEKGIYHLYVHTANPSHYVKMGSLVFNEALKRGFSVYPSNGVIPMLPDVFSSGVCSLNEDGDKLAITIKMDIDSMGQLVDFDIFKSIIHSNKQMDYDSVNEVFRGDFHAGYGEFYSTLQRMRDLSSILSNKRNDRGAVSLESNEEEFVLDSDGNVTLVLEHQRGEAQNMIENFMLLANDTIAHYAYYLNLPFIYRNHEKPTVQKSMNLSRNLIQKGYFIQKIDNIEHPQILQRVLRGLLKGKNKEERRFICDVVLKSMTRAYYGKENAGHFGLALDCYGTFTSPARKFSDLMNHIIIEEFLDNGIDSEKLKVYGEFVDEICDYISLKQKDADLLEKEINQLLMNRYADNFVGKDVKAHISFVNRYGIFVRDENGLTGVIRNHKNDKVVGHSVFVRGHEYKANEVIDVVLVGRGEDELLFDFSHDKGQRLVKKKSREK